MISVTEVEQLHRLLIDNFGGSQGIRDREALESALARPFQTFDTVKIFRDIKEKIVKETEKMTFAEFKEYLNKNKLKTAK